MRILDVRTGFDPSEIEKLITAEETLSGVDSTVAEILADVRRRGDAALCEYSERFDNFKLASEAIRLTAEEIGLHAVAAAPGMLEVLREAIRHVREFHLQQKDESWEFYAGDGVRLGSRRSRRVRPLPALDLLPLLS